MSATPSLTPHAAAPRTIEQLGGPRPWPLVGNLLQFDLPRLHQQMEAWAERHGPAYRLRVGRRDALVISDPALIATALRERPGTWRRMRPIEAVIREAGGHGVFSAEGADWQRQRRLVMSAFDPTHLRSYFPSLQRVTERLGAQWLEAARRGEMIDLQASLTRYTVDVTAGLAFGIDLDTLNAPHPIQQHLDQMFPMLFRRINAPWPYWRWLRLPADRAYDRALQQIHAAVRGFVGAARQRLQDEPQRRERPTDLLEAMLVARDAEGGALTEAEVVGNVITVLLAGEDTTAHTLSWAIWLLHTHRGDWQALVAEVDAALGTATLPPGVDAARGLAGVEAAVHEAMRLKPVAPLLFLEANHDTTLGAWRLPAGAPLFCLMRRAAMDERLAADIADFRPPRWREDATALRKASMPFGAGPRLCPGRGLALLEMTMVLAMLARRFELLEVGPAGGGVPEERLAFTMFPVGLRMRLAERRGG
ncbi:MAG TPA: cytochrome P450 [Methylibium sp.]|nr:cytochrome P450 [Methylibium sp.]